MILIVPIFLFLALMLQDLQQLERIGTGSLEHRIALARDISLRNVTPKLLMTQAMVFPEDYPGGKAVDGTHDYGGSWWPDWGFKEHQLSDDVGGDEDNLFNPGFGREVYLDPLQRYGFRGDPRSNGAFTNLRKPGYDQAFYDNARPIGQRPLGGGGYRNLEMSWLLLPQFWTIARNGGCQMIRFPPYDEGGSILSVTGPLANAPWNLRNHRDLAEVPDSPWESPYGAWLRPHLDTRPGLRSQLEAGNFSGGPVQGRIYSPFRKIAVVGTEPGRLNVALDLRLSDMYWIDLDGNPWTSDFDDKPGRTVRRGLNCGTMSNYLTGIGQFQAWQVRPFGNTDPDRGLVSRRPGLLGDGVQTGQVGRKHFLGYHQLVYIQAFRDGDPLPADLLDVRAPPGNPSAPVSLQAARDMMQELDMQRVEAASPKILLGDELVSSARDTLDLEAQSGIPGFAASLAAMRGNPAPVEPAHYTRPRGRQWTDSPWIGGAVWGEPSFFQRVALRNLICDEIFYPPSTDPDLETIRDFYLRYDCKWES